MENTIENRVGRRLNFIRELLLLTIEEVFKFTEIPITTLRRIENGSFPSNPDYTNRLCYLYQIDKEDLYNLSKQIPDWKTLRRRVLAKHKNNENIIEAINKRPPQKKALLYRALQSSFLNNFRTTNQTIAHLLSRYNWTYGYPEISIAFDSLLDDGLIEIKGKNVRPQQYRKSRNICNEDEQVIEQISIYLEETTPSNIKDLHTPVYSRMAGMLFFLRNEPKKRRELFASVNYRNLEKNHQKSLKVLEKLNLVEMTEEKPNSSLQKYRLTPDGIEIFKRLLTNL